MFFFNRISDSGGKILNRTVESLNDLHKEYSIIFNCTGLRAGKLCKDVNVSPIRGQVIRVKFNVTIYYVQCVSFIKDKTISEKNQYLTRFLK